MLMAHKTTLPPPHSSHPPLLLLSSLTSTDTHGHTKLEVRHPGQLDHQGAQVWRVEWNVTGTILATAADDGCVKLWKGLLGPTQISFLSLSNPLPPSQLTIRRCGSVSLCSRVMDPLVSSPVPTLLLSLPCTPLPAPLEGHSPST